MNGKGAVAEDPQSLPKFRKPPVIEVAISVFFRPLPLFKTAHYGRFWDLNQEYIRTEDQQPVVDSAAFGPESFPLVLQPRVLFLTESDSDLLQIQPNFFAHNWRRGETTTAYPGFEAIKRRFLEKWQLFRKFVTDGKLGEVHVTRYEIAYINHFNEQTGAFPLAIEKYSPVIKLRQGKPEHYLPDPKSLSADIQYEIEKNQGSLRASFKQGVWGAEKKAVMQLDMVARGSGEPDGSNLEQWLDTGHRWIVKGFADMTSEDAHKLWERYQ